MLKLNKQQKQRLTYLFILLGGLGLALSLILSSLKQNLNFFMTPTQALTAPFEANQRFRLGGQVKSGSVFHEKNQLTVHFILRDRKQEIPVVYTGILPDLFREGKGAIADGHWLHDSTKKIFLATEILAKHDENYLPRAAEKMMRTQ